MRTTRSAVGLCVSAPEKIVFKECNPSLVFGLWGVWSGGAHRVQSIYFSARRRDAERVCLIFHSALGNGREQNGKRWRHGGGGGSLLVAGEREGGYKDNFLSGLIALTVCRLPPSWRSLIEITCT